MPIKIINVLTLKNWLDDDQAIIIDVREPEEYANDCIKNAINIPLSLIDKNIDNIKLHQPKKIIMQCRIGVRSLNACNILINNGFESDVYNLEGGINAWRNAGF